jgi:3-oxoacyl-[acyl-carrier-protein] synthase II
MPPSSSAGPEIPGGDGAPGAHGGDIVVTGIGVISPAGAAPEAWCEALEAGAPLARETRLEGAPQPIRAAGIEGFSLKDFGSFKGTAGLSRTAQLAAAATALALREASAAAPIPPNDRVGVVLTTAFGNLESMVRFERGARRDGHRFVDPMIFPNTVVNAAAGHVSILFGFSALNSTVSAGSTGGLLAIAYAAETLRRGEADLVFAGGAEELSYWTCLGEEERARGAAGPARDAEGFRGEGAAVLALERAADARRRGAPAPAVVAGAFQTVAGGGSGPATGAARLSAARGALRESGRGPGEIGCVWTAARSPRDFEREDAPALAEIFGHPRAVHVALVAPVLGDWLGASAALQAAGAARSLARRRLPAALLLPATPAPPGPRAALITAADRLGGCAAAVLGAPAGSGPDA